MLSTNYPTPILIAYKEAESIENIQLKFRAIIKAFGISLKYCSLLVISDYVRLRDKNLFNSEKINSIFIEKIERPSLGHWNYFLRTILEEFKDKKVEMFIPELMDFFFINKRNDKFTTTKSVKIIDELIYIRNKYVHPDIYPSNSESQIEYNKFKSKFDELLIALSFLENYPLFFYLHEVKQDILCSEDDNIGNISEQKVSFYIKNNKEANVDSKLNLGNFFYSHSRHLKKYPVLLYESLIGKRLKFILGNYYVITQDQEIENYKPVDEFKKLIKCLALNVDNEIKSNAKIDIEKIRRTISNQIIDWDIFRELSKKVSNKVYDKFIQEEKFSYNFYIERQQINEEIEVFIKSDKNGFILVAESGLGKTNVFCNWERKLLKEGHTVFMLYGRDYNGFEIGRLILDHLGMNDIFFQKIFQNSFNDLISIIAKNEEFKKSNKKIVILFDAINEYDFPEKLFDNLMDFIKKYNHPWLKVIFNIRTFVWDSLFEKYLFDKEIFHYTNVKGDLMQIPYCKLDKFTESEFKEAFVKYKLHFNIKNEYNDLSKYAKIFLTNPLLLRYASEAYMSNKIPDEIFTAKIFEQYRKERINKKDISFLKCLVEAMIYIKNDELMFSFFIGDFNSQMFNANLLKINSVLYNTGEILSEKISEYIFEEPVYEQNWIPVCKLEACKIKELPLDFLIPDENDKLRECPNCRTIVEKISVDLRTSYTRLKSENIIQEFAKDEDLSIRFTFDRLFEFFVGEHFFNYTLYNLKEDKGKLLFPIIREFANNHIFWGAIKNVLLYYLRNEDTDYDFWFDIIMYENELSKICILPENEILVYQKIISSALMDFHNENSKKANQILLYITDEKRSNLNTLQFALICLREILSKPDNIYIRSSEIDILRRGIQFDNNEIILESSLIISSLYFLQRELVFKFYEEVSNKIITYIKFSKLFLLILPQQRKQLNIALDGLTNLFLILLGQYYSDGDTRKRIYDYGIQMINSKLFKLLKNVIIFYIAKKFKTIYYEKGFPCNYIEIYFSIHSKQTEIYEFIGNLYIRSDDIKLIAHEELIFKYSQINNGLLSWYLYSLIPIYGQKVEQQKDVLKIIENLYTNGNQISKYIAQKSLWILVEFAELQSEIHNLKFEEYSKDFIKSFGGYITYYHDCTLNKILNKYIERKDKQGYKKVYWAKYFNGQLSLTYDNFVINDLSEYMIRNKDVSKFDYIIDLLKNNFSKDQNFLFYIVKTIGQFGSLTNPAPSLKTIQYIIENYTLENQKIIFEGREQLLKDLLVESLLNIKCYYPKQVSSFMDGLETEHQKLLIDVMHKEVNRTSNYLSSYYGETIYQKNFLFEPEVRKTFGKLIIKSSLVENVDELFNTFVGGIINRIVTIKSN